MNVFPELQNACSNFYPINLVVGFLNLMLMPEESGNNQSQTIYPMGTDREPQPTTITIHRAMRLA